MDKTIYGSNDGPVDSEQILHKIMLYINKNVKLIKFERPFSPRNNYIYL